MAAAPNLRVLHLNGNLLDDLSPLTGMTELAQVWVQFNTGIDDLSPLSASTGMLEIRADATSTQPSYITDISVVASMPDLLVLDAGGHEIVDLSPLAGLTNLTQLRLNANLIADTTPLAGQCGLNQLFMQNNLYTCPDATLDALELCGVPITSDCP